MLVRKNQRYQSPNAPKNWSPEAQQLRLLSEKLNPNKEEMEETCWFQMVPTSQAQNPAKIAVGPNCSS
jgi:hypothetical protein